MCAVNTIHGNALILPIWPAQSLKFAPPLAYEEGMSDSITNSCKICDEYEYGHVYVQIAFNLRMIHPWILYSLSSLKILSNEWHNSRHRWRRTEPTFSTQAYQPPPQSISGQQDFPSCFPLQAQHKLSLGSRLIWDLPKLWAGKHLAMVIRKPDQGRRQRRAY